MGEGCSCPSLNKSRICSFVEGEVRTLSSKRGLDLGITQSDFVLTSVYARYGPWSGVVLTSPQCLRADGHLSFQAAIYVKSVVSRIESRKQEAEDERATLHASSRPREQSWSV